MSKAPPTHTLQFHYPSPQPSPTPTPAEPEEDDTLRQLQESLNDISYVTDSDDTPSLGSSSEDDNNSNDSYITDSDDTPSLESSSDNDDYSNGPTTSTIAKSTPTVLVTNDTETNPLHDHPLPTPSFASPLLQAAVRRQIEELEQKAWTSLTDEQRCHQVMMERFLRFTTEEDRQRDRNCGNAMFRRFGITQSSTAPLPGYYTRAVISHMGW